MLPGQTHQRIIVTRSVSEETPFSSLTLRATMRNTPIMAPQAFYNKRQVRGTPSPLENAVTFLANGQTSGPAQAVSRSGFQAEPARVRHRGRGWRGAVLGARW